MMSQNSRRGLAIMIFSLVIAIINPNYEIVIVFMLTLGAIVFTWNKDK